MRCVCPELSSLQFEEITINLVDASKKSKRKITVVNKQESSSSFSVYDYKVGTKTYSVSLSPDPRFRRSMSDKDTLRFMPPHARRDYLLLKNEISSLVEVSQISVYRQVFAENIEIDPRQRVTAVDERLQQLFERFSRYQLKLETQLNERSTLFQQEALGSLLYNEEFDDFSSQRLDNISEIDLETQEDKLSRAFKELGIKGKNEQISKHISKLRDALKGLKNSRKAESISVDDVFALPLIYRTNKIIDSLNRSEEDKRKIVEPRQKFFDTLRIFMANKKFHYDNKRGVLLFTLDNIKNDSFPWTSLSSGEKQLLIQFMEVILQEGRSLIFIADEPELSLHVTWQEKLLKALRNMNENAQLIVATHSPDIVADFSENVINMEKVISANV
ncbi:ATP-binding protein [Nostoc linckia FACHB-391]|uniref:ATP-binding protein n=1 Tax=Nostoc linckia FACHB-391 TaxID=2692906 RepID=A0ABR8F9N9_NOSLI|nr:ATP-binding protein [Nostoc linckia FACHB-391]